MEFIYNFVGLLGSFVTIGTLVYTFFTWYLGHQSSPVLATTCAFVAPTIGGLTWNVLCRAKGWPYHMGGSGNEPHGYHAFIWGILTLTPVIFLALLINRKPLLTGWTSLLNWFLSWDALTILLYAALGGLGACPRINL